MFECILADCSFIDYKMSIKIIFGLGNIGAEYATTRHNAGAIVLRNLADLCSAEFVKNKFCNADITKLRVGTDIVVLAFCNGYMNNSGEGVKKALAFYKVKPNEVAVIYDDISLDVGRVKISVGGSSGGHNGVADIMQKIGNDFVRIRIGIGAKTFKEMPLADYVLGKLSESDIKAIKSFDIKTCFAVLVAEGVAQVQNIFNRKVEAEKENPKDDFSEKACS